MQLIEKDYNTFGKEEKLVLVLFSLLGILGLDNYIHEIPKNVIIFLSVITMFSLYDLSKLDHLKKMGLIALSASTSLGFAVIWVIGEIINNEVQDYKKFQEDIEYQEHLESLAKVLPYNGYIFRLTSDGKIRSYKKDNPKYKGESDKNYKERISLAKKEAKEIFKIK
jgi:hypothetical protein